MRAMSSAEVTRLKDAAMTSLGRGDFEAALRACIALERLEPKSPDWPKRTAKVLRRLGRTEQELQALLRAADVEIAAGASLRASATLKQILAVDPNHAAARGRLSQLQAQPAAPRRPPPPSMTPARAASWQAVRQGGLEALDLKEVVDGARPARERGVYSIPLEASQDLEGSIQLEIMELDDVVEEATPPPPSRPAPREDSTAEDAIVLAVEEEFRAAERTNRALSQTPLFSDLDDAQLSRLLMVAKHAAHDEGAVIFRQGARGDTLYVIAEGTVGVIDEGPPRRGLSKLGEGEFFGEIALLTNQPRTATVQALSDVALIGLDRQIVASVAEEDPTFLAALLRFFRNRSVHRVLSTNPLFSSLSKADRTAIEKRFRFLEVEAGAELVSQGARPEGLLALLSGRAVAEADKHGERVELGQLGPGDLVAEMSLMRGTPAMGTVRAATKCYAVELPARDFLKILEARPKAKAYVESVVAGRQRTASRVMAPEGDDGPQRAF